MEYYFVVSLVVKVCALQTKISPQSVLFPTIKKMLADISREEIDVVCLPEKWAQHDPKNPHAIDFETCTKFLESLCKEHGIYIIGGAVAEKTAEGDFVTCPILDRSGNIIAKQRKIHLYLMERKRYKRGNTFKIIKTDFGLIGAAICFDLNAFPEVGRALAREGVEIIFNPVMVSEPGIENWHVYIKARALENRMPICGVNPIGKTPFGGPLSGESMLIGFKKGHSSPAKLEILAGKKNQEDILIKNIDLKYPAKLRQERLSEIISFTCEHVEG